MQENHDNKVVQFPAWKSVRPLPGYSKLESDRLVGRAFTSEGAEGSSVGMIVGTYVYADYRGEKVYGLSTEFKYLDSALVLKGSLNRCDLERTKKTMLLRRGITSKIKDFLKNSEKASEELQKDLHAEVYVAHHTRRPGEPGITL